MRATHLITLASLALNGICFAAGIDLGGVWRNTATTAQASTLLLSQQQQLVHGIAYSEWDGKPAIWHGEGKLTGSALTMQIRYSKVPQEDWAPDVTLELQLGDQNKTLQGRWKNSKGQSGTLTFERVR